MFCKTENGLVVVEGTTDSFFKTFFKRLKNTVCHFSNCIENSSNVLQFYN